MKPDDPLSGPLGTVTKFIVAALFGGLVSLLLLAVSLGWLGMDFLLERPWIHIFWIIPLAWGILGVVWFEPMLDAARHIVEGTLGADT